MSDETLYVWNQIKQLERLHHYQRLVYGAELAKTRWHLCAYYENGEYACGNRAVESHNKLLLYYCPEHQRLDDADRQRIDTLRAQQVDQQKQEIASVLTAYKQGVPLNEALRKQFEFIEKMGQQTLQQEIARIEEEINDL